MSQSCCGGLASIASVTGVTSAAPVVRDRNARTKMKRTTTAFGMDVPLIAAPNGPDEAYAPHRQPRTSSMNPYDKIPDVRDGLTREERVVLYVLHQTQKERGDRNVPTAMLWGRVCEYFYISPEDLSLMLARLGARKY